MTATASLPIATPEVPKLGGVIAAALTPFTEEIAVDRGRLRRHVGTLLAEGCDFVVLFGTTGDGESLATATKLGALEALLAGGVDPARLVPAVMATDVGEARRMVQGAADAGCRAVLVVPPFYYPANDDGVFEFFTRACDGIGIDLVLYHIPQLSRFAFAPALIRRLADRFGARLVGLKDSTGAQADTLRLAREFPGLAVFTGTDTDLPALLAAGGAGIIGGLPNINTRGLRTVVDGTGAEREAACGLASEMLRIVEANGGIPALRALVARRYGDDGWLRSAPPLRPLMPGQAAALLHAVAQAGFDLAAPAV